MIAVSRIPDVTIMIVNKAGTIDVGMDEVRHPHRDFFLTLTSSRGTDHHREVCGVIATTLINQESDHHHEVRGEIEIAVTNPESDHHREVRGVTATTAIKHAMHITGPNSP